MGTSSRSSSTLKNPFQTFKSFYTIQPTTRTIRMKFVLMLSLTVLVAGQVVTSKAITNTEMYEEIFRAQAMHVFNALSVPQEFLDENGISRKDLIEAEIKGM